MKIADKIVSLGLASCILLAAPGAQAYDAAGQLAATRRHFNYSGSAFEYYLKLQGINSTRELARQSPGRQQYLSQDYEKLQQEILRHYEQFGLLQDPFWSPQLVTSGRSLTSLGLWFGLQLLTQGIPEEIQDYLHQAALDLSIKRPDPTQQKPAAIKRALAQLFDHAQRSGDANIVENSPPVRAAISEDAHSDSSDSTLFSGVASDRANVVPSAPLNSKLKTQNSKLSQESTAVFLEEPVVVAAEKSSGFFRTILGWLGWHKTQKFATDTVSQAGSLVEKNSARNIDDPAGGSENVQAASKDFDDQSEKEIPGPGTGVSLTAADRVSLAPQPAGAQLARVFDGQRGGVYLVSTAAGPVSIGSTAAAPANGAPAISERERREGQMALEEHLGNDSWLAQAGERDARMRRLATEMAAYNTLTADRTGDPKTGDPTLREQTQRLETTQAEVEQAIVSYQAAIKSEEDWRVTYQQLKELSRSEESMTQITKASSDLVAVLLLKRGYMFMDLALQKLSELEALMEAEKEENQANREELSGKEREAQRKLEIAKDLYDKALRGEFVREVDEYIAEVEEMLVYAEDAAELIVSVENILNGTVTGDLGGTFLDPSVVAEEISMWTDLQLEIEEQHDAAEEFVDVYRAISVREPDDFGDYHYVSAHLWAEELINQMESAQAAIQVSVDEFEELHKMREDPDLFYVGVKGDPQLQTDEEQEDLLILRREGESLINFGAGALEFKTAESTLNALQNAYVKDAGFAGDIGVEPYYDATISRMEESEKTAQETITIIQKGLEMERPLLVDELDVVTDADMDSLLEMIEKPYQSSAPEGLAHRAYDVMQDGKDLAEDALEFYNWKMSFLSSGPSFFEILDSDLIQMQSELVSRQVEFANKLLDFLRQYYRPSQEALTDTYAGLVSLYETGYGTLYEAEGTLYDKESEGLETMEETIAEIAEPFQVDFETIKSRLAMLNDMDDPAIRRLGRALSDAGDELLTRLNSKKFLIHAREERERKQRDLKESLERLRLERERTQELLNRGNPEDPNFYKAWDLVQRGNLLYDPEGFDDDSGSAKPGALFVRQDSVQKILLQASAMTGNTPSVQDWVRSLGLSDYEVFPVGSGSDSFYTVVHFAIGTSPSLETFDENILEESLIKFGNLGSLIGHNVSVSLYDFKDLEVAVGSRGIRTTFERDKENEKYINTTVIDIHNNLQQGHIFRALIFENMAFMTLGDRLFISANGYGDLPMIQGQAQHCLAEELGLSNCDSMPFSYSSENDDPPYIVGGRAKGVFYFHEVASLNAEAVRVFAQDPHTLEGYINTSLDPLDMNEEYFTIEGAILNYLKLHGGVTIDLAKIFSEKQTFAIEFFMEKETATETDNGAVSEEYLENYADNYDKLWKGAQLIKEINFKLFGHQTRLAMETRAAWDQDNALEVAEELSFYFPKGFSLSLAGARYGGDLYGKVSVNSRIAPGTDLFLSYGNDRINTDMDLMIGLSSTLSIEQFRRNAASSAERAMAGGQTLSDFQRGLEKTFDSEGRGNGDAGATQALPLEAAMMRALTHDAGIAALTNAIGIKEQETRQLRRVVEAGLSGQGGIVLGEGFTDMVTGNDQNSYGYWSTAGGLQVGVAAFFGLTQPQKKEALKEIVQMKVLLLDLKEAYEKAMDEFRLGVLRVILARLRLKQLEALKDRTEIGGNPLLRSQLDLNIIQAVKERAIEEAALRARIGLSSKDPLPKEIEEIFINPNNPQETIDAAMKAAGYPGGWNKLLVKIAEANPNKAARPPLYSPERIFEAISPLQLLPFIDALTISAGTTLEDSLGNSQASIGASVEITLWDPERGLKRKSVLLEADMADLRAAERLAADRAQNDPYIACFDRWALGTEKKNFESVIPKLWAKLAASRDLAEQLSIIDQITLVNREISRIVLESFSVPGADCPKETRQKLALSGAPRLLEEAKGASSMLAELELQRQSAGYLEKAARRRVQLKTSLGITYNPVDNLWFETPATFFISDAWSWLIPALNLTIKHKASKEADTDYSQALIKASEADFKIQTLELTQQIITSYLRLVFAKSIKDELVAKAKGSTDPAEIARLNVDILELRRSITHESQKLIILLGKDPAQFEVDLETLARLKPQETAESLRPWSEANLKGAPGVQLESLRTRLELVRALEAQLLIDERSMNIKTEPVSALLQVAAQLIGSFFGDGGDTTSMVDLQALTRYRQDLERQIREWEAASGGREREAEIVLARAQKAWQDDPTFLHLLGRELAWVSQASGGFDRPLEYSYLPRSNTREMAPVIQYKARIYDAEQGICADPALCTKDGDRRPTSEVGEGSVYYDGRNTKKATFYEGFVQILLRRPELVNPRLMVKAEELQQEHQARLEWLEKDLRQARLFGLVWKYNYLNGQLSHAVDESTKKSIEKLMAQTQEEILIEFGLKSPEEYPAIVPPQSTMDPEALETLMNISLQYLIGDAPILGALRADLALGQLEAQAIIDNLRYQSMNPSFVLGYFRNGIVGGLMLSAPLAGITPGAELFRDLDRIIQANMTSVLEARSLAADARERLARNYFEFRYLIDEIIQRQINLDLLRRELSIDPFNPKLTERYYQNYEDLLLGTSRLHQLYLQIEMDLKLLGVNIPPGLGRSGRDPWAMEQRSRAMSPGEAQRVTRHWAPSVMSGWSDLAEDQKTERFSEWSRRLEAQCRSLGDDLCRETKKMSFKIQKDTAQEFHSDEPPIGIITPAETNGEFHPEIARTINREEFEAAQAQGQIWQYHAITGNLIPLRESWNQNDPKRLFLAPGGASPSPPASVAAASRLGALEIHLSQNERLRLRNAGFSASEAWRRQSHRHDAYLDTPDSYAVLSGVAGSSQTWRVVLESEALELVEKQELSLKRSSTGETIDPAAFKSQEFWNHDMLEIYLNGDYRFENYSGERIWTYEELWREGRLAVFEEIPGGGSWNRVHASVLENPSWGERALKILAYFGSTPEIVGSATLDQLMLETSFVREIILTQRGAERLKNQAEENLGQARQAAYVYLKTVHGFSRDGQGRVTEIYLTAKEMEKAKKRHSKSELYLSGKMVLFLTTNGQITEVLMNAMDGKQTRLALQGDTAGAGQWGSEWAAIELGSDYRVLRIYQASDLKDGVPNEWAYYMDDRKIYHINDNIFPGGADAGRARALATVNTANGSLVLAPSTTLNEGTRKAQRHINRVIAHNVIGTLALAGEIGVEAVFAPWTLPFGAGVGGANVAERVSTRAGEGSMEKSWGFWFDALREVGDFVLFKRVIPQPKDRLNDPSGNPVQITEKPATFWDRALYWATFTLCGRIDERRVEVDPETHEKTYHYVRPGLKALRRSQGYHIEEEESRREQALAQFNGGLALQESKTSRGVYGDYRESHVQVIPKGESYARALTSLRSLGVRLTPDGAFYLDVVPMEAEVSGQVIPGITGAEQNFAARAESTQDHSAETAMIQGAGGTLIAFYENGVVKERSPSVGESALKHWQRQIEMTMQMSEGVLYDSQTQIYVDSRGRWLFNPATLTLVSFDERGQVKQTYQAVPSAGAREEKAQKEAVLSSYYTNYSVILEQGAVIHLNAQGEIMAYETGVAAVNAYLADHSNLLLTDESMETQGQILFEKSDGAGDLVINPAAALISAP